MNNRPNLWQDWAVGYRHAGTRQGAPLSRGGAACRFLVGGIVTKMWPIWLSWVD